MEELKEGLWNQLGASIDMLENAISRSPEVLYESGNKFFYLVYHSLVFLDYYLTIPPKDFSAPLPFTLKAPGEIPEEAIDDVIPDQIYTKAELLNYLKRSREKCHQLIMSLTAEKLSQRFVEEQDTGAMDYSIIEILLYNLRHVQHHVGQLNMLLRQMGKEAPRWVSGTNQ